MADRVVKTLGRRCDVASDWNQYVLTRRRWRALHELRRVATAITLAPVECMWSWGDQWQNQWHGVSPWVAIKQEAVRRGYSAAEDCPVGMGGDDTV